jgi:hypothetical protein
MCLISGFFGWFWKVKPPKLGITSFQRILQGFLEALFGIIQKVGQLEVAGQMESDDCYHIGESP